MYVGCKTIFGLYFECCLGNGSVKMSEKIAEKMTSFIYSGVRLRKL